MADDEVSLEKNADDAAMEAAADVAAIDAIADTDVEGRKSDGIGIT